MPPTETPPAIEMRGITKRFAGIAANDAVDFVARRGEVHALIGENGAGKSTLMSIFAGLYRPDAGSVAIDGAPVVFRSPRDAIGHGIGMVYQHFMLVDTLTVAENVMLAEGGQGQGNRGRLQWLDTGKVERALTQLGEQYGLDVDPRARIWQLSVGEQQRVEILRLLYRGARILVLDEPTAVLTPQESAGLVRTLRGMASDGFCVVFISHKLDEVLAVADEITVLRRGRRVATMAARDTDRETLARLMVGRELAPLVARLDAEPHDGAEPSEVVIALHGLCANNDKGLPALDRVDLEVRAGEILGIAGVAGNGQRELAETVTGLRPVSSGHVVIDGRDLTNRAPGTIAAAGVAHVPEDRLATGLIPGMDLSGNAVLRAYRRRPLSRGAFLSHRAIAAFADRLIRAYDVKAPGRRTKLRDLSGGNQQKLLLARELAGQPRLVVAVHPTRGVAIGATQAIHDLLRAQRARGAAILLISEDLDELLSLSDRIAVLYDGRVTGTVAAAGADPEQIGLLMTGVTDATDRAAVVQVHA